MLILMKISHHLQDQFVMKGFSIALKIHGYLVMYFY